jgi:hypothetical protein
MTTLADLVGRLRMNAGDRPAYDTVVLPTSLLSTDLTTPVTFADGSLIAPTGIVDFDDGTFEACLMRDKPTGATGTIVRGWDSVAAAHSAPAPVRLNPRYRAFHYRRALNVSLGAIGAGFRRNVWDSSQTFGDSIRIIPVPAAATKVLQVAALDPTITAWHPIPVSPVQPFPTAICSTGKGVRLSGMNPGIGTAYVWYQDPWPALVNATDTLDPDYPADAEDLILLGAEAYLEDSDTFSIIAFQEPHVKVRQFGSHLGDVRGQLTATLQRFITRRTEVASRRPAQPMAWMRGL